MTFAGLLPKFWGQLWLIPKVGSRKFNLDLACEWWEVDYSSHDLLTPGMNVSRKLESGAAATLLRMCHVGQMLT